MTDPSRPSVSKKEMPPIKDFDSLNWTPYGDARTNAELRAQWEELGRGDPKSPKEAGEIMYQQDLIGFELQMRKWHHISDDWVHPRRASR
jgi:hypothetical protein